MAQLAEFTETVCTAAARFGFSKPSIWWVAVNNFMDVGNEALAVHFLLLMEKLENRSKIQICTDFIIERCFNSKTSVQFQKALLAVLASSCAKTLQAHVLRFVLHSRPGVRMMALRL